MPPLTIALLMLALQPDLPSDLAQRLREGDREAFRQFFDRYHMPLFAYLRGRGFDSATAEESVQEAFIRVWEHRHTIDPARSVRAYLYRIAVHQGLNARRSQARYAPSEAADEMPDGSPSPESDLVNEHINEALRAAVDDLPDRRRAVFELCFMQELTYREAAEVLEISIKTVENQMAHALRSVRNAMQPFHEEARPAQ